MTNREECRYIIRHLWAHLDGELSAALQVRVAAHLEGCTTCRSHFDFERSLLAAIRAQVRLSSGLELAPLRARVISALADEGFHSQDGPARWAL